MNSIKVRNSASFRIRPDTNEFQNDFLMKTGLKPSKIGIKGEPVYEGLSRTWENNYLSIKAPLGNDVDLEKHLLWLWNLLKDHKSYIRELNKREDIDIDIFGTFTSDANCPSVFIKPEAFMIFTELNISFEYSILA